MYERSIICIKRKIFSSLLYGFVAVTSKPPPEDDAASAISSEPGREVEPEGEETETAPEGEGDDEDSVTRCIW